MSLIDRMEPSWPPVARFTHGPFVLRQGLGGGSRVSAISLADPNAPADQIQRALPEVEAAARTLGQPPLFLLTDDDAADTALANILRARGYALSDEVFAFEGPLATAVLAAGLKVHSGWPADADALAVWNNDGRVGAARMAVMARARGEKAVISLCDATGPVGALFAAIHDGAAVLHAIEVIPAARGRGYGHALMIAASDWARAHGADRLMLVVTKQNLPAVTLYLRHGLQVIGGYYYLKSA